MKRLIAAALAVSLLSGCTLNPFKEDKVQKELQINIENNKFGFVDMAGGEVIPAEYDFVHEMSEGVVAVKKDGKFGYVDIDNKVVIPFEYDDAKIFINGVAAVCKDGKWGFIDKSNDCVIDYQYDMIEAIIGGYKMRLGDKWILCKSSMSVLANSSYESIGDFSEGYAKVKRDGLYGFIDESYGEIVPCVYENAGDYSDGVAYVVKDGKYGYIDQSGGVVVPFIYSRADDFDSKYARVELNGKSFFIDRSGNEKKIPYDDVWSFDSGLAVIVKDGMYGIIDEYFKVIRKCELQDVGGDKQNKVLKFSDSMAPICKDGLWGYISRKGTMIFPCQFENAKAFSQGIAAVKIGGKWGFINERGDELSDFAYDLETDWARTGIFKNGYCIVKKNGLYGCIDLQFREIIPCTYPQPVFYENGLFCTNDANGKKKYIAVSVKGIGEAVH